MIQIRSWVMRWLPTSILLTFPFIYKFNFVNYESFIQKNKGVDDLLTKLELVLNINGNIIECGSGRCGTSVIIAKHLKEKGISKKIYALDLFGGGFDLNELQQERRLGLTKVKDNSFTRGMSYEYAIKKINKLGLSDFIVPVKGLFEDTLPQIDSEFCLAFIDCDLKKSMTYCAERIWPRLSENGIMLFDDYEYELYHAFKGPKIAVDEFVSKHNEEISEHKLLNRLYYVVKNDKMNH